MRKDSKTTVAVERTTFTKWQGEKQEGNLNIKLKELTWNVTEIEHIANKF